MTRLRLTLLGGFQAHLATGGVVELPGRKAQALLAYLAVPLGRAHPRDKLAALLWGGIREDSARASLRQTLFVIRKALGGAGGSVLQAEGEALVLASARAEVDVAEFEHAVSDGAPDALERAGMLYRGDLLAGLALDEPPFEEWLLSERERLRELALEGLAKLLAHQRRAGARELAVQTALKLLTLDALQEPVHRTLMRLYTDLGRRGAALRQYQACVTALQRELGTAPEAETKALYQDILRQRATRPAAAEPLAPGRASDAREHRAPGANHDTTLLGRADELSALCGALDAAASGEPRVVAVVGEAGIGKSRLVGELATEAARRGAMVLVGRSYESEQILPFGPWVDALRAGRVGEDTDLLERLGSALRAELARLLPEAGAPPAGGATDVRPVFESVAQVIGVLAGRQPLLVVLEDIHWTDEMSARLVAFVGRRLAGRHVLLVATAREEELTDVPAVRHALDDLRRDALLTTLTLGPLSHADTVALVRAITRSGDEAAVARLGEQAWATSEGNPFVTVETARAYAEGAGLGSGRGLALPERVRDVVGRRLEHLSERGQALAAVAAVIGRDFEFALLQRVAGLPEEDAAAGVEELVRRRVLHGLGERFDFAHDRIRDVAYDRILAPRRRLLHRRVAESIEALQPGRLESQALALGLHYRSAEAWERAARYLRQAGVAAYRRAANREAVASLEAAIEAAERLPEGPERSGHAIDIRVHLENALMGLGQFTRSLERLREAESLAHAAGDRPRLARVYSRLTYNLGSVGRMTAALETGERALALATEADDVATVLSTNVVVARALYGLGDYRRTIEIARRNDALAPSTEARGARNVVFSRIWSVLALAEVGAFEEGGRLGADCVRTAAASGWRHEEVWARLGLGRLYVVQGAWQEAIDVLEPASPLSEAASDLAVYFSRTAASLGEAYARLGRLDEGLALLERAAAHAQATGFAFGHSLIVASLAGGRLLAGDIPEAARLAGQALELARAHGQRGWEAWALRLLGELAARADPPDVPAAERHFREGTASAHAFDMRPLLAHCRLGLGIAYARAGRGDTGPREIESALAEYRALQMPYWTERAERARAIGLDD